VKVDRRQLLLVAAALAALAVVTVIVSAIWLDSVTARIVLQQLIVGITTGMLFALIALGYSLVYGILELINFAHGDLFMLSSFLALTLMGLMNTSDASGVVLAGHILLIMVCCSAFGAGLNWSVDRVVYKALRNAPKLAPLVSAIGVSFIFMNLGLFWGAMPLEEFGSAPAADKNFPDLLPRDNLLAGTGVRLTQQDLFVIVVAGGMMIGLYLFVRLSRMGKAMRATAQNPTAARLMGIDVDRVIGATFALGGALAGVAAVVFGLYVHTIKYTMGYQNGLYAFTAAVLGGIGSIPGAVIGGLVIGLVRAFSDQYIGGQWQAAVVFGMLIVLLVFRPTGLLGSSAREKV
jgi:branched-chain amino acid transport system permease protein